MILLTGATGFVGRQIFRSLQNRNETVRVVVRTKTAYKDMKNSGAADVVLSNDLFTESAPVMMDMCNGVSTIVHAAWYVEPGLYLESPKNHDCLSGTLRLARAALERGVSRFVGLGTCLEYAPALVPISVDSRLDPRTTYARAKLSVYYWLASNFSSSGRSFSWCRLFYLFGVGEDERRLVPYLHSCLAKGQQVKLTSGEQIRDYLDVEMAGELIAKVAVRSACGAFNICSGNPVSIRKFAETIAASYGRQDLLQFGAKEENTSEPPYVVGIRNC